MSLFDLLKTYI